MFPALKFNCKLLKGRVQVVFVYLSIKDMVDTREEFVEWINGWKDAQTPAIVEVMSKHQQRGLKVDLRKSALARQCGWVKVSEKVVNIYCLISGSSICFLSPEVPLGIVEGRQDRAFVSLKRLRLKMQMAWERFKILIWGLFKHIYKRLMAAFAKNRF